jgi:phosphonatase-like hydrolase
MDLDLIVFDMAGTTVNDEDGVNRCVRESLAGFGIQATREAVNEVMGIPKPQALRHLIVSSAHAELVNRLETIHEDFVERMIRFYHTDASVREIPGAGQTFARLREGGIKVALDTGFSRDIVDVVLERLGWNRPGIVDATVSSDEVARGRPHPDMVFKAMEKLGLGDARRVGKVGDTPSDLQEGTSAGCGLVVGVTGGSHTAEQLAPFRPTHLIASVADLPELLGL